MFWQQSENVAILRKERILPLCLGRSSANLAIVLSYTPSGVDSEPAYHTLLRLSTTVYAPALYNPMSVYFAHLWNSHAEHPDRVSIPTVKTCCTPNTP
jgi:hypothetical protein